MELMLSRLREVAEREFADLTEDAGAAEDVGQEIALVAFAKGPNGVKTLRARLSWLRYELGGATERPNFPKPFSRTRRPAEIDPEPPPRARSVSIRGFVREFEEALDVARTAA